MYVCIYVSTYICVSATILMVLHHWTTSLFPQADCCHDCPLSLPLEGVSTESARCDYSYVSSPGGLEYQKVCLKVNVLNTVEPFYCTCACMM